MLRRGQEKREVGKSNRETAKEGYLSFWGNNVFFFFEYFSGFILCNAP